MESTGVPNLIQVTQKTANLIRDAGKGHWLVAREDLVMAKGKGMLQTYFVDPAATPTTSVGGASAEGGGSNSETLTENSDALHVMGLVSSAGNTSAAKLERLIEWNADTMKFLVKNIVARRRLLSNPKSQAGPSPTSITNLHPRNEVTEVIVLPEFDFKLSGRKDHMDIELSEEISWQIRDLVSVIGYMYRGNPFHNFEHASHVVMSTMKLLQRVVSPEVYLSTVSKNKNKVAEAVASNLHFSSYGITSDPLTQFAIVFAALVHDVDHGGVSNNQLVVERDPLALKFEDQSPAEQHSVCVAWEVIMRPAYEDLRAILFASDEDQNRFRQLLVNSVMATDIFDPELKKMREMRWSKAFASDEDTNQDFNRKATIVIEQYVS
jgi:hypothetical protein